MLVNHSDTLGGAAIVTFRLMQALRQIGVDARMVVFTKTSEEETISDIYSCFIRSMAFVMERLSMLPALGFKKKICLRYPREILLLTYTTILG